MPPAGLVQKRGSTLPPHLIRPAGARHHLRNCILLLATSRLRRGLPESWRCCTRGFAADRLSDRRPSASASHTAGYVAHLSRYCSGFGLAVGAAALSESMARCPVLVTEMRQRFSWNNTSKLHWLRGAARGAGPAPSTWRDHHLADAARHNTV